MFPDMSYYVKLNRLGSNIFGVHDALNISGNQHRFLQ